MRYDGWDTLVRTTGIRCAEPDVHGWRDERHSQIVCTHSLVTSRRDVLRRTGALFACSGLLATSLPGSDATFRFDASVPAAVRQLCRRVAGQMGSLVDRLPDRRVTVTITPDSEIVEFEYRESTPMNRVFDAIRHLQSVDRPQPRRASGQYDPRTHTLELPADGVDGPLIAHELTHAIQFDRLGQVPTAESHDGSNVRNSVVEGTADLVQERYREACLTGEFDRCALPDDDLGEPQLNPWLLAYGGVERLAGAAFVRDLLAQRGWPAVWRAHRTLPSTMAAVLFPARYFEDDQSLSEVSVPRAETGTWLRIGDARLGVAELLVKLVALNVVDPPLDGVETVSGALDELASGSLRSPLLRRWRGDRVVGYGHINDPDTVAYQWKTRWATEAAAAAVADSVAVAYDERGVADGGGWQIGGGYHDVTHDGATTTFTMAPSSAVHTNLFDSDASTP